MENQNLYDSDDDFMDLAVSLQPRPRSARNRFPDLDRWSETEFFDRFRFSKPGATFILEKIRGTITSDDQRGNPASPEEKLLTTLSFFATGSFMSVCGDRHGLSKSSVSVIVHQVSRAIARLANEFICFPQGEEDRRETRRKFHSISRFPCCLGALDCTHVKIFSPGGDDAEMYRNRKSYYSINVQTVADADLKITNIVARWPGSTHHATIFHHSGLRRILPTLGQDVILADSGYGLGKQLLCGRYHLHRP